ncbi:MarR family winged helix-turn-helix transcriptional regulator [Streptomyces achromogenes]|jgi:DNA-binding MarR family transcriptional regulator|uniref:MarR family winged helix-turn-helix transcriptional regulator n=1 Tax=Streptomyces achromogenes TaxID=67255 RepID=A0ABZ1KFV6_STRAH|nr:MarR family winged helix-turn-helix transcriptional regulator [Streptomyces achromogenes]
MSGSSAPQRDVDSVASALADALPALYRALDRRVARDFPHPKPPEGHLNLLRHVAEHEGATVREAAEALLMKPNNVSALVSQLTEQGLLERGQDSTDKRVVRLRLTPVARRRLAEVRALQAGHLGGALRALTEGELDALGSALGALESLTHGLRAAAH